MVVHYAISHALTVVTAIAAMLIAMHLLGSSRTPQSLMAWALALAFIPLVAIPAYLMFGTRKFPLRAKRPPPGKAEGGAARGVGPVSRVLLAVGAPQVREGNTFELLPDGVVAYEKLMELILGAQRSIHLTIFILADDAVGWSVVEALAARARAGVEVRVVVDAVGSTKIARRAARSLAAASGSLHTFMPLIHAPLRGRNNLRSHRKLAIFDGHKVFVGGMNIAEEYMGPTPLETRWRDLAAVVSGSVAADCETLFASDYHYAGGPPNSLLAVAEKPEVVADGAVVQFVPSGPDMLHDTFYDAILTAMHGATKRITIVTPYYVPDDVVQSAIALAARRGVTTELIMPEHSNHALADFARRGLVRGLREAGVRIMLYPRGMVHTKGMVVDDTFAYVGSPNMDMRSFFLNYEDALCIYSSREIGLVRGYLDALLGECVADTGHAHSHWVLEQLARLVAPEL